MFNDKIRPSSPTLRTGSPGSISMQSCHDSTALAVIGAKLRRAQAKRKIMLNNKIRVESPTLRVSSPGAILMQSNYSQTLSR